MGRQRATAFVSTTGLRFGLAGSGVMTGTNARTGIGAGANFAAAGTITAAGLTMRATATSARRSSPELGDTGDGASRSPPLASRNLASTLRITKDRTAASLRKRTSRFEGCTFTSTAAGSISKNTNAAG